MRAISVFFGLLLLTRCALSAEFQLLGEMLPIEWRWTAEALAENSFAEEIGAKAGLNGTNNFLKQREISEADAKTIVNLVKRSPGEF